MTVTDGARDGVGEAGGGRCLDNLERVVLKARPTCELFQKQRWGTCDSYRQSGTGQSWTVSQHVDRSENTEATSKCRYAQHSHAEIIFTIIRFVAQQYAPSSDGAKCPQDGVGLYM